jgi:hypothetical protein
MRLSIGTKIDCVIYQYIFTFVTGLVYSIEITVALALCGVLTFSGTSFIIRMVQAITFPLLIWTVLYMMCNPLSWFILAVVGWKNKFISTIIVLITATILITFIVEIVEFAKMESSWMWTPCYVYVFLFCKMLCSFKKKCNHTV